MAKDDISSRKLRCSFCGKTQDQVRRAFEEAFSSMKRGDGFL